MSDNAGGSNAGLYDVIQAAIGGIDVSVKSGRQSLQPTIARALRAYGLDVDEEDARGILPAGWPVWRSKDDGEVVPTTRRRRVDLVAYEGSRVVALIETESDLNDLRLSGVTRRNGHYDVFSIARDHEGKFFHSYNSLERMAVAAFAISKRLQAEYGSVSVVNELESISSDDAKRHNPLAVPIVLVTGTCRTQDREILRPRLMSLGAKLLYVTMTV